VQLSYNIKFQVNEAFAIFIAMGSSFDLLQAWN